jgi:hypothetical protein
MPEMPQPRLSEVPGMATRPPTPSSDDELEAKLFLVGRRRLLQWTGAAVGASMLGTSSASATPRHALAMPLTPDPITTAPADSLVEAIGARINEQIATGSYGNLTAVRDAVAYAGIRYAREETVLPSSNPTMAGHQAQGWPLLAAIGCRVNTIIGKADARAGTVAEFAAYHKSQYGGDTGGVLWGIESANEWNGIRGPGIGHGVSALTGVTYSDSYPLWAEQLAVWQKQMWSSYALDPALDGLAILGPALVNALPGNSTILSRVANTVNGTSTGLQNYLTYTNYHVYPGQAAGKGQASVPSWHIDQRVSAMKVQAPNRPWVCTESGMHNALNSSNTNFSAHSETAAGIYAPRMTLEHLLRGTKRQWFFGLADDYADPGQAQQDIEFGLFHADWTPKPAAKAVSRMTSIFKDPGSAFTPTQNNLTVAGDPTMLLHSLRFGKRDGTTLLALWRDVSVWDYVTQSDLVVPAQTATVTFTSPSTVQMYRPSVSDGVYATLGANLPSVDIALSGDVTVLAIT